MARTRSTSRSETGQPAAGERSQTLPAVAAWGTAVDGAGAAVGVREGQATAVQVAPTAKLGSLTVQVYDFAQSDFAQSDGHM